jgi:hypothetical protein
MIRKTLQSALCLLLSPLLVAQQAAQQPAGLPDASAAPAQMRITLPLDTNVYWIAPVAISLASAKTGELAQFTVDRDVVVGGATVIHSGVPVAGVIANIKHSSRLRHRDGQVIVRITEVVDGKATEVFLQCPNPADRYDAAAPGAKPNAMSYRPLIFLGVLAVALLVGLTSMDK